MKFDINLYKSLPAMLGKTEKNPQLNLSEVPLVHFINLEHELCQQAKKVNWDEVEKEFSGYYSTKGAPSVPIRTIVGLIILKQVYHYSDKTAIEHWLENPYWQHFSGEVYFQHKPPFYYSDFGQFHKRIGKDGDEKIMKIATTVFGKAAEKAFHTQDKKKKKSAGPNILGRILGRLKR